eukprot:13665869-Ditylum_brightwellii.AAC.1
MTSSINGTNKAVLMSATSVEELPAYTFYLATLPENQNGLGIYNPANSAVVSFLIPFIWCLHSALQGITLHHKTVHLSPYLSNLFADWHTSVLPIFVKFSHFLYHTVCTLDLPNRYSKYS